jgi:hypothetical protein
VIPAGKRAIPEIINNQAAGGDLGEHSVSLESERCGVDTQRLSSYTRAGQSNAMSSFSLNYLG